jgi:uncharacterized membrane protein YhhN
VNGLVISVLAAFAVFAVADWVAVARGAHRVEYVCKPAATVTLIALALALPEVDDPAMRFWFVVALVASLAGDVFLMLDDRWFLAGLGAFLVGHLGYVVGLAGQIGSARGLAAGVVLVLLAVPALGVRIVRGARARDARMALPVAIYMAAISGMVVLAFASGMYGPSPARCCSTAPTPYSAWIASC